MSSRVKSKRSGNPKKVPDHATPSATPKAPAAGAPKAKAKQSKAVVAKAADKRPPDAAPGYRRAPVHRPRAVSFGAGPDVGVRVLGFEVCQSIQDLNNSVTLIAGKETVIRVYLDHGSVSSAVKVRGEICWRKTAGGPASYVASIGQIQLDPRAPKPLAAQRESVAHSLGFRLPVDALGAGDLYLELNRLIQVGGGDLPSSGATSAHVVLVAAAPIRVKVIGLRYTDPQTRLQHAPDAVHFAFFRSYLRRAYPVSEVIWSQIVVDANFAPPFNGSTVLLANAQIAAIRNSEINGGVDPRTHYYGLVDDGNGRHFMRGRATGIPQVPQPDTVASGPCGVPNGFAGDNDQSYADWYGAHELGHTFGRFHPGFPPGSQDASDPAFPYANGQLSNGDGRYVGFDVGDHELNLPMSALPGTIHHDVMTYADRQWLSAYTYEAIRTRLSEEDQQFGPAIV